MRDDLVERIAKLEQQLEAALRALEQLRLKVETAEARSKALGG